MLTVGTYKTRGGVDAVIVAVVDGFAIGYRVSEGPSGATTWNANSGSYCWGDGSEDSWDIIDARPRIKFERWATIGRCDAIGCFVIGLHSTLENARSGAECVAIARIEIDCVEGENLD